MATQIQVAELYTPVVADTTGFARSLGGATSDAKSWAANIGATIGKAGLAVVTGGAVLAAGAVLGLGAAIGKMTLDAAGVEGTVNTFNKLVESVGGDAVRAMEMLRASTRGMVADADLMAASNKFLAMGIVETTEEAAHLAEVSTQLGMAMGEDATASMENFALMMANQSIPRLDSFGISSSTVRERIAELMEETEGLSREQAFNTAVMEQAAITMERVGEQSDTAAGSMSRIRTTFANVALGIGQAFLPALEELLTPIADIAQDVGPQLIEWAQMAGKWLGEKIPAAIDKIRPPIQEFINGLMSLARYFAIVFKEGDYLNDFLTHLPESIQPIIKSIGQFIDAVMEIVRAIKLLLEGDLGSFADIIVDYIGVDATDAILNFVDSLVEFGAGVKEAWATAQAAFEKAGIREVLAEIGVAFGEVMAAVKELWQTIAPILGEIFGAIRGAFDGGEPIKFADVVRGVAEIVVGALKGVASYLKWVAEVWSTVAAVISKLWSEHGEEIVKGTSDFVKGVIRFIENLRATISVAFEALRGYWQDVLLPAIEIVWAFIQDNVIPLFEVLAELLSVIVGVALEVLAGLWQNVLQPALEEIWRFIQNNIIPIFEKIAAIVSDVLGPALDEFSVNILEPLASAFDGISSAIKDVIGWVEWLIEAIGNIKLPDALTPGSTTPFETGLRGIADAMRSLSAIEVPRLSAALELTAIPIGGAPADGEGGGTTHHYGGDTYIINDRLAMALALEQKRHRRIERIERM